MSTESYLQAFATILSLINPAICAPLFERSQAGRSGLTGLRHFFGIGS